MSSNYRYFLFIFGFFVIFSCQKVAACTPMPKLTIENQGTVNEKWKITIELRGADCPDLKTSYVDYSVYNYRSQSVNKNRINGISDGIVVADLRSGDKLRYKACVTTPPPPALSSQSLCPPAPQDSTSGGVGYYLGCGWFENGVFKPFQEIATQIINNDPIENCQEEYFEFMPLYHFPMEATLDCENIAQPKVKLYVAGESDNFGSAPCIDEDYLRGDAGIMRGDGERFVAKYCAESSTEYYCVLPYFDTLVTSDTPSTYIDDTVSNFSFYHYRMRKGCAVSDDVTIYVDCPVA